VTVDYTKPPIPPLVPPGQQPPAKSGCAKYIVIGCIIVIILFVVGCAILFAIAEAAIKRTDLYQGARDRAVRDERVIAAIGPCHAGWWVIGSVHVESDNGSGRVKFPLEGNKGDAKVEAESTINDGKWEYSRLVVTPENGPPIDLLH
jgi:hypothetical protein